MPFTDSKNNLAEGQVKKIDCRRQKHKPEPEKNTTLGQGIGQQKNAETDDGANDQKDRLKLLVH